MIKLSEDRTMDFLETLRESYESQKVSPLYYAKWFGNAFPVIRGEYKKRIYPYEVRIAKTASEYLEDLKDRSEDFDRLIEMYAGEELVIEKEKLLKEVLQPKEVFTVEEPFMIDGTEVWFGETKEGINLRIGYKNGDSRYPTGYMLGSDTVHTKLGGATGMGKSVLQNQIIVSMLLEYPPWELELTLCDFKFTEMVRYCNTVSTPHVGKVVACDDIDYVLSLLKNSTKEMKERQNLFAKCDVADIGKFRSKFDLVMPQRLNNIDEVQRLFTKNVKKNPDIEKELEESTKLGRALGDHLAFASQSMKGTISKDNLANFKLGISLYCESDISTMLIGNDQASSLRGKGKCYINSGGGKKEDNVLFKIPFIEEDKVTRYLIELNKLYDGLGKKAYTDKYDENLIRKVTQLNKDFEKYDLEDTFILGDSVRFKKGEDYFNEFVSFDKGQDSENVLVISLDANELFYAFNLLFLNNMKVYPECLNLMVSGNPYTDVILEGKRDKFLDVYTSKKQEDIERTFQPVNIRKGLIEIENRYESISEIKEYYTHRIDQLKSEVDRLNSLPVDRNSKEQIDNTKDALTKIEVLFKNRTKYGWMRKLTIDRFPLLNIWVYDAQSILGLGREPVVSRFQEPFKNLLFDSTIYNVRYYVLTSTIADMAPILNSCNHRIYGSKIASKDGSKLNYFENLSVSLMAYQNKKSVDDIIKFKVINLGLENIVKEKVVKLRT